MSHRVTARVGKGAIALIRSLAMVAIGLVLLLGASCSPPPPTGTSLSVARVISGQTVEVLAAGQTQTVPVRLAGLNAPDLGQLPWGPDAKRYLEDLLLQRSVVLESDRETADYPDPYGRQIAYLWLDGQMVNETLLAQGQAMVSEQVSPKYAHRLAHAQHQARLLGLGIWNPAAPMRQTPVEFRQQSH
ncbi:MAG: thermonuclease family protein [Elainellaceae cyanobacterium]